MLWAKAFLVLAVAIKLWYQEKKGGWVGGGGGGGGGELRDEVMGHLMSGVHEPSIFQGEWGGGGGGGGALKFVANNKFFVSFRRKHQCLTKMYVTHLINLEWI